MLKNIDVRWVRLKYSCPIDIRLICNIGNNISFKLMSIEKRLDFKEPTADMRLSGKILSLDSEIKRILNLFISAVMQNVTKDYMESNNTEMNSSIKALQKKIEHTINGYINVLRESEKEEFKGSMKEYPKTQMIRHVNLQEDILIGIIYDSILEATEDYKKNGNQVIDYFYKKLFSAMAKRYHSMRIVEAKSGSGEMIVDEPDFDAIVQSVKKPEGDSTTDIGKELAGMKMVENLLNEGVAKDEPDSELSEEQA